MNGRGINSFQNIPLLFIPLPSPELIYGCWNFFKATSPIFSATTAARDSTATPLLSELFQESSPPQPRCDLPIRRARWLRACLRVVHARRRALHSRVLTRALVHSARDGLREVCCPKFPRWIPTEFRERRSDAGCASDTDFARGWRRS